MFFPLGLYFLKKVLLFFPFFIQIWFQTCVVTLTPYSWQFWTTMGNKQFMKNSKNMKKKSTFKTFYCWPLTRDSGEKNGSVFSLWTIVPVIHRQCQKSFQTSPFISCQRIQLHTFNLATQESFTMSNGSIAHFCCLIYAIYAILFLHLIVFFGIPYSLNKAQLHIPYKTLSLS